MSPPDDTISFKEREIIRETARAVLDEMSVRYPPSEYGKAAFKKSLEDYFGFLSPSDHQKHHGWLVDHMNGVIDDFTWRAFWFDIGKAAAKIVLGGALMLIGLGLLDYIRIYLHVQGKQ